MLPAITIGLPVRNASSTILDSVRSVFAQSFTDWELLVVDDGSTDDTLNLVSRIRDPRVRVIADGRPLGLPGRLNQIAAMARAPLVARMDGDDLMHPDRLARQVEYMERHPECMALGTSAWIIDEQSRVIGVRDTPAAAPGARDVLRHGRFLHPTVIARRAWFLANPYDANFVRAEDHELWCRTFDCGPFGLLDDRLFFYRDYMGVSPARYAQSCRTDREIFRRYGPAVVGWPGAVRLMAESWAKQIIYTAAARSGLAPLLGRLRNGPAPDTSSAGCESVLTALRQVQLPGIP